MANSFYSVNAHIEGLGPLARRLSRIDRTLTREGLKAAHRAIGETVISAARPRTPRRGGRMENSMRAAAQQRKSIVRAGSRAIPYPGVIHWGWPARHITAQPWLSQAAVASEPVWAQQYNRDLIQLVENTPGAQEAS